MKNISKNRLMFDLRQAIRFLDVLGKGQRFTFQIFDDSPLRRKELALIRHGSFDMHREQFCQSNESGAGVFAMINQGNERGRSIEGITKVRALFVDMDGAPMERLFNSPMKPHMIVETSPGRGHAYFLVSDMSLKDFSRFQKALAHYFGGDELINDLCRVMRLPGFYHQKTSTPFWVKILQTNSIPPYLTTDLVNAFGLDEIIGKSAEPSGVPKSSSLLEGSIPEGQRNNALTRIAGSMRAGGASETKIKQGLILENQHRCSPPLSEHEVIGIAKSVAKYEPAISGANSGEIAITGSAKSDKTPAEEGNEDTIWSDPIPLTESLYPVMPFDPDLLPKAFRAWAIDIAERMQCPIDYIAVGIMVVASSLIGRQIGIMPKREDDWLVIPNLWGAIIGRPGATKSPALAEAMSYIEHLEREAATEFQAANTEWQVQKLTNEASNEANKAKLKKLFNGKDSTPDSAMAEAENIARAIVGNDETEAIPLRRRYKVNDSTVEKLGELLAGNPNGLLLFRDELTGFMNGLDKEGHEKDRAFYLESWSGTQETFTYDRIGRGTIDIKFPCISALGGMQPGPLGDYINKASKGNRDDGFMQRFQLTVWPDIPPAWENIDRKCDEAAKQTAFSAFERLHKIDLDGLGAQKSEKHQTHYLRFAPLAYDTFVDYREKLEHMVRNGNEDPAIESHFAKYRSLVPSIALICHLIDYHEIPEVTLVSANRAIRWASYLETHARRVYGAGASVKMNRAKSLLKRIKDNKLGLSFTARDVYRNHWSGLDNTETVTEALETLETNGFVRGFKMPGMDGRPSIKYYVNPKCLEQSSK